MAKGAKPLSWAAKSPLLCKSPCATRGQLYPFSMEYFYLDDQNAPQGPCSKEELYRMLVRGDITPATKVSFRGASEWQRMSLLFHDLPGAAAAVNAAHVGNCPRCSAPVQVQEDLRLPKNCPRCHAPLRADGSDFMSCVSSAFSQYATFRGRATRAEYWWFQLFCYIVSIASDILLYMSAAMLGVSDSITFDITFAVIACIIIALLNIALLIPNIALTVRRLHDTGHSGYWLLWMILAPIVGCIVIIHSSPMLFSALAIIAISLGVGALIYSLAQAFILLIWMLTDSDRGANKYGPSSKYPLG